MQEPTPAQETPATEQLYPQMGTPSAQPQEATPATTETPDLAQLQRERDEFQSKLQQAEQSARYHQSRADKQQQALAALTGNSPQQQPLGIREQLSAHYTKAGYKPDDVLPVVEPLIGYVETLQRQNQQLYAMQQSGGLVDAAMTAAYADDPEAMGDPSVQVAVRRELQYLAQSGQPYDAEHLRQTAAGVAMIEYRRSQLAARKGTTLPAAPQAQNISSMFGQQPGFQPRSTAPIKQEQTEYQRRISADFDAMMAGQISAPKP